MARPRRNRRGAVVAADAAAMFGGLFGRRAAPPGERGQRRLPPIVAAWHMHR